jgi:hypothetical protein
MRNVSGVCCLATVVVGGSAFVYFIVKAAFGERKKRGGWVLR